MLFLDLLIGCVVGGGSGKYTDAEPCDGAHIIDGDWTTEVASFTAYDGSDYGSDITGCQTIDYQFALSIGGNRNPAWSGGVIWGGILQTGDVETRDWINETAWTTNDASFFAAFTDVDGVTWDGWNQVTCYPLSDTLFDCMVINDYLTINHDFTLEIDPSDPNKMTIEFFSYGTVFMGDRSEFGEQDLDCSHAQVNSSYYTATMVRETAVSSLGSSEYWLADYDTVECAEETTATTTTEADRTHKYNGHDVVWWTRLAYNWWDAHRLETLPTQKNAANATINQYVLAADRTKIRTFVYEILDNYTNGEDCYIFSRECSVRSIVDLGYSQLHDAQIPWTSATIPPEKRKMIDEAAWAFGRMYEAWENSYN